MRKGKISKGIIIAIAIILVAIILLFILPIFLIKPMVKNMPGGGKMITDSINSQIENELKNSEKKLFIMEPDIIIGSGKTYTAFTGVINKRDVPLKYNIKISDLNENYLDCTSEDRQYNPEIRTNIAKPSCFAFFWESAQKNLAPGNVNNHNIKIFAPNKIGTFMFKISIMPEGEETEYASQTFFITTEQR